GDDADREDRMGELVHEYHLGNRLHPGAQVRGQTPQEIPPEVSVTERLPRGVASLRRRWLFACCPCDLRIRGFRPGGARVCAQKRQHRPALTVRAGSETAWRSLCRHCSSVSAIVVIGTSPTVTRNRLRSAGYTVIVRRNRSPASSKAA